MRSVLAVAAQAAGVFRRTPIERTDQQIAWERPDQAFFAAGACHLLAWVCRDVYPDHGIQLVGMRLGGDPQVSHTYAIWRGWAFDHSGWNAEKDLLEVNAAFEGRPLELILLSAGLGEFCRRHNHRLPDQYWQDPIPRARSYLSRHPPPWT